PVLSAGSAYVTEPPGVGFPSSFFWPATPLVAGLPPPPPLPELPQLASSITMISATATAPPALRLRDPRTDPTFPPNGYEAGTLTGSSRDECDRRHSGS